ncbi:MAG: PEP-CTERM sorting domain-containing protein [Aulosira sp. DedQUE10]|nr:PEP-CTERM sorting domain-containing protein [Aulosira sp. DedQUE10]
MKFLRKTVKAVATMFATTTVLGMAGTSVMAFSVTQNNDTNTLLNSLLGDTTGLSNFTVNTTGNAQAFGLFKDDPFGLKQGVVLSTGKVVDVVGPNNTSGQTTNFGTPGDTAGSYDLAKIDISFTADNTVDKLFFNYVFGSEEFLEYAGSQFNDSFELLLNGTNLALLGNGNPVTINNLANSSSGPFDPAFVNNIGNDTQLDGYTKILTFAGALDKNATNTLSIKIKDVADGRLDSAVFIQGNSVGTTLPPSNDVPEPLTILGTLTAAGFGVTLRRKQKQQQKVTSQA